MWLRLRNAEWGKDVCLSSLFWGIPPHLLLENPRPFLLLGDLRLINLPRNWLPRGASDCHLAIMCPSLLPPNSKQDSCPGALTPSKTNSHCTTRSTEENHCEWEPDTEGFKAAGASCWGHTDIPRLDVVTKEQQQPGDAVSSFCLGLILTAASWDLASCLRTSLLSHLPPRLDWTVPRLTHSCLSGAYWYLQYRAPDSFCTRVSPPWDPELGLRFYTPVCHLLHQNRSMRHLNIHLTHSPLCLG